MSISGISKKFETRIARQVAARGLASYAPVSARAHFICFAPTIEDLRVDVVNQRAARAKGSSQSKHGCNQGGHEHTPCMALRPMILACLGSLTGADARPRFLNLITLCCAHVMVPFFLRARSARRLFRRLRRRALRARKKKGTITWAHALFVVTCRVDTRPAARGSKLTLLSLSLER